MATQKIPIVGNECELELRGSVVRIDVDCGDPLMAQVLFDDLCERASKGSAEIRMRFKKAAPRRALTPAEKQKAYRERKKGKPS